MIYVFDTGAFIELFRHFYPSRFPTLWASFDELVAQGSIVSVREVANELTRYYREDRLTEWLKANRQVFQSPSPEEMNYVRSIFAQGHYQALISRKSLLQGSPVADPFVVAKAKHVSGCVVTQEHYNENAAKVPNVCEFLGTECADLEGFMEKVDWSF